MLFTWPSKAALLAYGADKESATASRDAYLNLLNDLADMPGIGRIHILAHSMGTWLTMEALRERPSSGSPDLHGKLGNVMLAAPDIDLSVFKQQIARLDPSHFSVYVSKDDRALQVSASIQGDRRLGSLDPESDHDRDLIEKLGIGVYDISYLSSNLIGHDNYANAPQVVRQIDSRVAAPRAADQAVIDAGADRTPRPAAGEITTGDLPPPGCGDRGRRAGSRRERMIWRSWAELDPGSAHLARACPARRGVERIRRNPVANGRVSLDGKDRSQLLACPKSGWTIAVLQ